MPERESDWGPNATSRSAREQNREQNREQDREQGLGNGAASDRARVGAFLTRAAARLTLLAIARGAAAGLAFGTLVLSVLWLALPWRSSNLPALAVGVLAPAVGALIALARSRAHRAAPALVIERCAPQCRNVLVTAEELLQAAQPPASVQTYVHGLVVGRAALLTTQLDIAQLLPARRTLIALAASIGCFVLSATRSASPALLVVKALHVAVPASMARVDDVIVTIIAPAYAALPPLALRNPSRVEALQGSRLALRIRSNADSLVLRTLHGAQTLGPTARDEFTIAVPADADGFVGIEPKAAGRAVDVRRLIGLTVNPDALPGVRITTPGHDMRLQNTHATISLAIDADDDVGLGALTLRYTKVSGSGERFSFADGEVPLVISRADARHWSARAVWALDSLALGPGDMVVYRAIAADRRPGAPVRESDSFIAEIVAPGSEAIAGFSIDPDQERYAVSQQMVVLKTERLIARRAQMLPDSTTLASQELAAEQRKVRAEFVFMMGGELADAPDANASMTDLNEEAEAEGEADIAAGRMANQGRIALMKAIRSMSRAAALLTTADLTAALVSEKAAVTQLEQAFSRQRIILRALSEREQLDLTRRLSGALSEAHAERRLVPVVAPDARANALRRVLAEVTALAGARGTNVVAAGQSTALAERVLRLDPSRVPIQQAAAHLSDAATSFATGRERDAHSQMDFAATVLSGLLREVLPSAGDRSRPSLSGGTLESRRLGGALRDAIRDAIREPGQSVKPRAPR